MATALWDCFSCEQDCIIIIIIILINAPMQVHGEGKGERWKMKWHYIHDKLFTTESAHFCFCR